VERAPEFKGSSLKTEFSIKDRGSQLMPSEFAITREASMFGLRHGGIVKTRISTWSSGCIRGADWKRASVMHTQRPVNTLVAARETARSAR